MRIGCIIGDVRGPATARDLTDQARAAHAAGLTAIWAAQALGWDALAAITLAGSAVPEMSLGTAVVPTPQRHPLVLAGQALSAQAATGNRLTLGVGAGIGAMLGGMFGLPADRPVARMREYLSVLRPLLRGESVAHEGETLTAVGAVSVPGAQPPQVLLAALGPAMLRLAAEQADGVVTWMTGPRTLAGHIVPAIPAGHRVVAGLPVCVTTDEPGVRARIGTRFAMAAQVPEYRAVLDREGAVGAQDVAIVGDEASVARQLRRFAEAGVTDFMAAPFGTPAEQDRTVAALAFR
jgi:F420-dependent oxidoreductase-like protein